MPYPISRPLRHSFPHVPVKFNAHHEWFLPRSCILCHVLSVLAAAQCQQCPYIMHVL